jgi:hypothetical protein
MMDVFIFWIMKPLAEIAMVLAVLAFVLLIYLVASIPRILRQRRCKHDKVFEGRACNAHCSACGKNLGFIGTWHDAQKERNT